MKFLPLVTAVVLASLTSAFAITNADIAPAALVGKTLTFTAKFSTAPFVAAGTWTGKFETSPANGFTIIGMTGLPGDISTTRTYASDGSYEAYRLGSVYSGSGNAVLSIYTNIDGTAGYELNLTDLDKTSFYQAGSFTIGSPPITSGPEIIVQQGKDELTDGVTKKSIGSALVGKSVSKTFTIKNTGTATLKNISIAVDGKNKSEFTVTGLGKTSVAKDKNTTFIVTFKPKSFGVRNAAIHIKSNDKDESSFDIKLTGTGIK